MGERARAVGPWALGNGKGVTGGPGVVVIASDLWGETVA
jgi:hypothetical protein